MNSTTKVCYSLAPLFTELDVFLSNPQLYAEFDTRYVGELRTLFPENVSLDRSQNLVRLADSVATIQSGLQKLRACAEFDIFALCAAGSVAFSVERIVVQLGERTMGTICDPENDIMLRDSLCFGASAMITMDNIAKELLPEAVDLAERVRFRGGITSQQFTDLIQEIINDLPENERPKIHLKDDPEYQKRLSKYLVEKRQQSTTFETLIPA